MSEIEQICLPLTKVTSAGDKSLLTGWNQRGIIRLRSQNAAQDMGALADGQSDVCMDDEVSRLQSI
jgi:hypothetical protein